MLSEIGIYSYLSVSISMLVMVVYLSFQKIRRPQKIPLILICVSSILWSLIIAYDSVRQTTAIVLLFEAVRYSCWFLLLLSLLPNNQRVNSKTAPLITTIIVLLIIVVFPISYDVKTTGTSAPPALGNIKLLSIIIINIFGLGIVEQITRNSDTQERWKLKYLLLGSGAIFTYDFCMFSDGLMFQKTSDEFWLARGAINTLAIPLLFVGVRRLGSRDLNIKISRNVIFHSATVITAAIYLLLMATAGYYVRYINESLGGLFLLIFIFGGIVILATLLFSDKLRRRLSVTVNKHFFDSKHDYRRQWAEFTHRLASSEGEVPLRICQSIAQLVGAGGALLWSNQKSGQLVIEAHWHIPKPKINTLEQSRSLKSLVTFIEDTQWVVDIDEYLNNPSIYLDLELPNWITKTPRAWLLVPLLYQETVLGVVLLKHSDISTEINWEDRDLLKLSGKQAAIHLSQFQSENELIEARQFEAYHRLSTYVMHDLKNILAQQSLIVSNAEKHKSNPAFIDDVLGTVENSVERMRRLLRQMKSGDRTNCIKPVSISKVMVSALENRASNLPKPDLQTLYQDLTVEADEDQLIKVLEHLLQNAQEATDDNGSISVTIDHADSNCEIRIKDSGKGMSEIFIRDRLFRPFDTTKGLTGMGIGVFESRQYLTSIGGSIDASSIENVGSEFTLVIPANMKPARALSKTQSRLEATQSNTDD